MLQAYILVPGRKERCTRPIFSVWQTLQLSHDAAKWTRSARGSNRDDSETAARTTRWSRRSNVEKQSLRPFALLSAASSRFVNRLCCNYAGLLVRCAGGIGVGLLHAKANTPCRQSQRRSSTCVQHLACARHGGATRARIAQPPMCVTSPPVRANFTSLQPGGHTGSQRRCMGKE